MRAAIFPSEISGMLAAPPSKSMAHRALLCAALADGESHIHNLCDSQDIAATRAALCQLGAAMTPDGEHAVRVRGTGGAFACGFADGGAPGGGFTDGAPAGENAAPGQTESPAGAGTSLPEEAPENAAEKAPGEPACQTVDCRESGSTLRFLLPLFSLTGTPVRFTGRGRLMERPQAVYEQIFRARGLTFERGADGILIRGALTAGSYALSGGVSSQFISGLLFALPLLAGGGVLRIEPPFESRSYVDLTLRAMADFGVHASFTDEYTLQIPGGQRYRPCDYTIEGDDSQAAFPAVLGAVRGGVTVTGLRPDSLQGDRVIMDILKRCGAHAARGGDGAVRWEKSRLRGTQIDLADCPDLGPVLMVLGALCEGETVIRNAARLRMKESDRIEAMERELRKMGARVSSTHDTVTVRGGALHGAADLDGHNDHRVVMALAVAALAADVPAVIGGAEAVQKSWPDFFEAMRGLGGKLECRN